MSDPTTFVRPVPRWVRVWAALTVVLAAVVVVLGGLVTSFRVGMSDPVWPTEPWFLAVNGAVWAQEPAKGFLIEHIHRLAAWGIGVFATVLALGAWAAEPNRPLRWQGLGAVAFLLVAYLGLHGEMGTAWRARKAGVDVPWPAGTAAACGAGVVLVAGMSAAAVRGGSPGGWVRSAASVGLVGVMIQGLLGGYRVYLDQLMGTQLAAVHGTFAQVVFAVLASVVFLAGPRRADDAISAADRERLREPATLLPAAVFVQLVWGVWLRHMGSPVAQRLHVLTAFVVVGMVVWVATRALATAGGRNHLRFAAYHLLGIVAVQVMLGVEGWMAKYAAVLDATTGAVVRVGLPKEKEAVSAALRTAHVVIGTALLASAVTFALRVRRTPLGPGTEPAPMIPRLDDSKMHFLGPAVRT